MPVPCRGCGLTYHRLKMLEGHRNFKCRPCGIITKTRVRCWAEICRVFSSSDGIP